MPDWLFAIFVGFIVLAAYHALHATWWFLDAELRQPPASLSARQQQWRHERRRALLRHLRDILPYVGVAVGLAFLLLCVPRSGNAPVIGPSSPALERLVAERLAKPAVAERRHRQLIEAIEKARGSEPGSATSAYSVGLPATVIFCGLLLTLASFAFSSSRSRKALSLGGVALALTGTLGAVFKDAALVKDLGLVKDVTIFKHDGPLIAFGQAGAQPTNVQINARGGSFDCSWTVGPFADGVATLKNGSLEREVARLSDEIRSKLDGAKPAAFFVVGSFDKRDLRNRLYGSNIGLAQQRALAVSQVLERRWPRVVVLSLARGPAIVDWRVTSESGASDRAALICALR